jgi:tRNA pseudouridine55 synthase
MAQKKHPMNKVNGWVILDKPLEVTSTKAVNIIRRTFRAIKAGHSGTLDPLATGILPIALGEATKTIPYVMDASKEYDFTITWGAETITDDREGQITTTSDHRPSRDDIAAVLPKFIGKIKQVPPTYSAIKLDGRRAYDLARNNEEVELKARDALVHALECHNHNEIEARFSVTTGKGVYVRSLARDLARALGTAGHIKTLRRCRVGPFSLDRSISLDFFEKIDNSAVAFEALHPVLTALDDIPALAISKEDAIRLRRGQKIMIDEVQVNLGADTNQHDEVDNVVMTALWDGQLVAIVSLSGQTASPSRVFNL